MFCICFCSLLFGDRKTRNNSIWIEILVRIHTFWAVRHFQVTSSSVDYEKDHLRIAGSSLTVLLAAINLRVP
jgi:hypothetical protein